MATKKAELVEDFDQYKCDSCGMKLAVVESPKGLEPLVADKCAVCLVAERANFIQKVRDGLRDFEAEMDKNLEALKNRRQAEMAAGNLQFSERIELQLKQVQMLKQTFILHTASWRKQL